MKVLEDPGLSSRAFQVFRLANLLSYRLAAFLQGCREDLPSLLPTPDAGRRDYRLLAKGLAALLAKCPRAVVDLHLRASAGALRSLRRQFRVVFIEVSLPADVLNDLAHEIALCADPGTRAAANRCFLRAVAAERAAALSTGQLRTR